MFLPLNYQLKPVLSDPSQKLRLVGAPLFCVRLRVVGVSLKKWGDEDVMNPPCLACPVTDPASLHHHSNPTGWVWLLSRTDEAWEAPKGQISSSVHTAFKWEVWTQVCLIPKAIPSPLHPGTRWWTGTESLGSFQSTKVPRSHPQRFSSNWSGLFFFLKKRWFYVLPDLRTLLQLESSSFPLDQSSWVTLQLCPVLLKCYPSGQWLCEKQMFIKCWDAFLKGSLQSQCQILVPNLSLSFVRECEMYSSRKKLPCEINKPPVII